MRDFNEEYKVIKNSLPQNALISLATCARNEVSARTMSAIIIDGLFYFQTYSRSLKVLQLSLNANCAIAFNNYEITGHCENLGHPMKEENKYIFKIFKEKFESAASKYSHIEQELLFCVIPKTIKIWEYTDNGAQIVICDIKNKKISIEKLGY